jgi:hypothetical protein
LQDLNLSKVSEPKDADQMTEQEVLERKALKVFHMAWSGITKYLRTITQVRGKPVEFPALGIFVPVVED